MKVTALVLVVLAILACAVIVVLALVLVRLRRMRSIAGFVCSYRPTFSAGWTEGFGVYGRDQLRWYRAISLRLRPDRAWSRSSFDPAGFVSRGDQGGREWGEVAVSADGHRFYLFMAREDYVGLLAWAQAAPPRAPRVGLDISPEDLGDEGAAPAVRPPGEHSAAS